MNTRVIARTLIMITLLATAVLASSCDNSAGFGMTPEAGPRWGGGGGGMSGPAIFPGGPSR